MDFCEFGMLFSKLGGGGKKMPYNFPLQAKKPVTLRLDPTFKDPVMRLRLILKPFYTVIDGR